MNALEELLSDRNVFYDSSSPGVYVRTDKDRELDILWENFRPNTAERSPGVYLTVGFITGAICMFLMTAILNFGNPSKEGVADLTLWKKGNEQASQVSITPSSPAPVTIRNEEYTIRPGDSLERISLRFYGTSHPDKIKKIKAVNGLRSSHRIVAGKKLLIPIEN